jgi:competence protein ComEC
MKNDFTYELPILRFLPFLILGIFWKNYGASFSLLLAGVLFISLLTFGRRRITWTIFSILLFSYPSFQSHNQSIHSHSKPGKVKMTGVVNDVQKVGDELWSVYFAGEKYLVCGKGKESIPPEKGQTIQFIGDFKPFSFDKGGFQQFMLEKGTIGKVYIQNYQLVQKENRWESFRNKLISGIASSKEYNETTKGVALAVGLGDRSCLNKRTKDLFLKTGVYHYLAISGLHVGIVYLLLGLLVTRLPIVSRFLKLILVLIALSLYVWIAGGQTSVLRAGLMFGLIHWGRVYGRQKSILNITFFSALVQLLWNPQLFFDLGFQLSYAAVIGIIISFPFLRQMIFRFKIHFIPKRIIEMLLVGISAFWWTYPILCYSIGEVYPLGILYGVVVAPLFFVITIVSLINLPLISLEIEFGNFILHELSSFLLKLLDVFSDLIIALRVNLSLEYITLWYIGTLLACLSYNGKKWFLVVGIALLVSINI